MRVAVFLATIAYAMFVVASYALAATDTAAPVVANWSSTLNTALLVLLAFVQQRHYRRSSDADYRAYLIERRLRNVERKLGIKPRNTDPTYPEMHDEADD